jgi:hypothetical protein
MFQIGTKNQFGAVARESVGTRQKKSPGPKSTDALETATGEDHSNAVRGEQRPNGRPRFTVRWPLPSPCMGSMVQLTILRVGESNGGSLSHLILDARCERVRESQCHRQPGRAIAVAVDWEGWC